MEEGAIDLDAHKKTKAPFYVVKCPDCSSEQVIFSRPSQKVTCVICGSLLATPTGGLGKFRSEIVRDAT